MTAMKQANERSSRGTADKPHANFFAPEAAIFQHNYALLAINDIIDHAHQRMMGAEMASRDNVLLVFVLSLLVVYSSTIPVKVEDVKGYTKLRSRGDSALYRVQADTRYEVNPLLIHLVGSRYGGCGSLMLITHTHTRLSVFFNPKFPGINCMKNCYVSLSLRL